MCGCVCSGADRISEALKPWPELVKIMHAIDNCDAKLARLRNAWLNEATSDATVSAKVEKDAALWRLELAEIQEAAAQAEVTRIEARLAKLNG